MVENERNAKLLSIIVPCYNEEMGLRLFHGALKDQFDRIREKGYDYEVIYVDDGSRDRSLERILEFVDSDRNTKFIPFRNYG